MNRRARPARSTLSMKVRAFAPPVVAGALVLTAALLPEPDDGSRAPQPVAVNRTAYACPAGMRAATGQVAPATRVTATQTSGARVSGLESLDRWRRATPESTVVVEQLGQGSGAVGFFAGSTPADAGGGLLVGSCPATSDESWFVGLGSGGKHESSLLLTNVGDVIAVADVTLWGIDGPIDAVGGQGLVIEPGKARSVTLNDLAAGEPELGVRVERRRGTFSVTALDRSQRVFAGSEVAPPTAAPSRHQLISGVPASSKYRSLVIANPSSSTSRVAVSVVGAKGEFVPRGLEALRVPAGRVTVVELPGGIGSDGMSIRLEAEYPVAAAVRIASGKEDYLYAVAARPLNGPAIVPVDLGGDVGSPRVTVTAPTGPARVAARGYDRAMKPLAEASFELAGDTSLTLNLRKITDDDDLAYIVLTPEGSVVGAAAFQGDDGVASLPLESAPVQVLGPDVLVLG